MTKHGHNCALCGKPTRSGKRGTYSKLHGGSIYLCHGVDGRGTDCYIHVGRDHDLYKQLTGKEHPGRL